MERDTDDKGDGTVTLPIDAEISSRDCDETSADAKKHKRIHQGRSDGGSSSLVGARKDLYRPIVGSVFMFAAPIMVIVACLGSGCIVIACLVYFTIQAVLVPLAFIYRHACDCRKTPLQILTKAFIHMMCILTILLTCLGVYSILLSHLSQKDYRRNVVEVFS